MYIGTFYGSSSDLQEAITRAERGAQQLLGNLSKQETLSVTAQTLIDRWTPPGGTTSTIYVHIITIAYSDPS